MRASSALQSIWQRTRRPRTWGAALLFGLVWNGTRIVAGFPEPGLIELFIPSLWVTIVLVLAPVPWQWTGDEAPLASPLRGAMQALPWMAALTLMVLLLLGAVGAGFQTPGRRMAPPESGPPHRGGMLGPRREEPRWTPIHPRLWLIGVANLSFGLLLGWVLADRERAEFQEDAARRAAAEAQARALQGQMHPHVLFNAISGLSELVREDPVAAEAALVNLANLLRALMEHGSRLLAPLGDERRLVELHLTLERLRLGRRLRETWHWPEALDGLAIPPLMIQPLVENALKHGVAVALGGGALDVAVSWVGGFLQVRVANTGPAPEVTNGAPAGPGIGLRNLQERLSLMGAPANALRLHREGDWTVAELTLEVKA